MTSSSPTPRPAHWRHEVWADLQEVALPDSRFHLRFSDFIPDFQGSSEAMDRLFAVPALAGAGHVFVTPDNSMTGLRQRLLEAGVGLVVSSYNMARGFWYLAPGSVAPGQERFAAWLDGLEHFGQPVDLAALSRLGRFDWVATGSSAVATSGVRFGRGHGFFDLEWRIFGQLGLVDDTTPIATAVHDVQVLEQALVASPDDVPVDWIFTPTRVLDVGRPAARPRRVDWARIDEQHLQSTPPLAELHRSMGLS
ncbi:MAG: 5-formyltetrahydrofolate cyclo-ligase [Hydrogenophaga sp.]|nr:5-formyltetrahydrofolate cyclo-ligase [Hydrogenophaga sp.]